MDVRAVDAAAVRPLRRAVLRPHQALAEMAWPGDEDPRALHVAAVVDEDPVAVASVVPEPHPRDPREGDWRVRGMATIETHRGRGLGEALLERCLAHVRREGGARVWCHARTAARPLYARAGFVQEGEDFLLDRIGPHVLMARSLARPS